LIRGVPHAKHPLIAPHTPNTSTHLIRQCLKGQTVVSHSERTGKTVARTFPALNTQEGLNRFLKPAMKQMFVTLERNQRAPPPGPELGLRQSRWKVKPLQGVEEEQRPHPFIEILASPPERLQDIALPQQLSEVSRGASRLQRLVADLGVRACDQGCKASHRHF
jgi:hypothetical protein